MTALPPAVTTASYRVSQGETAAVTSYHRTTQSEALRAQATRAHARGALVTALALIVAGLLAMAVGEWQAALAGCVVVTAVILTAAVTVSIATDRSRS